MEEELTGSNKIEIQKQKGMNNIVFGVVTLIVNLETRFAVQEMECEDLRAILNHQNLFRR